MKRTYSRISALIGWLGLSVGFLLFCSLMDSSLVAGFELTLNRLPAAIFTLLAFFYAGFLLTGGIAAVVLVNCKAITVPEAFRFALFSKHPKYWLRDQEGVSSKSKSQTHICGQ